MCITTVAYKEDKAHTTWYIILDVKDSLDLPTQEFIAKSLARGGDYFEWGCGASTLFAAKLAHNEVVSIENDPLWAKLVQEELASCEGIKAQTLHLELINLGPIRKWGYPELPVSKLQAESYFSEPFLNFLEHRIQSNHLTVLIDGRYRKSCALTVLLQDISDLSLIIDDTSNRPHLIEFANKVGGFSTCGRAQVWESSTLIDKVLLTQMQGDYTLDPR